MLVYRQMNIGTAKPSAEELQMAPHHLVDILPPDASYSVADFQQQAAKLISQITLRGNLPILVGGTGLYIKALLEDYQFSSVEENPELRRQLETFASEQGTDKLYARLKKKILPQRNDCIPMMCAGWCARWKRHYPATGSPRKNRMS